MKQITSSTSDSVLAAMAVPAFSRAIRERAAVAQIQFRKDLLARAQIDPVRGSPRTRVQDPSMILSRIDEFSSYLGCLAPIRNAQRSATESETDLPKAKSVSVDRSQPRRNPFLTRAAASDSITSASQLGA